MIVGTHRWNLLARARSARTTKTRFASAIHDMQSGRRCRPLARRCIPIVEPQRYHIAHALANVAPHDILL